MMLMLIGAGGSLWAEEKTEIFVAGTNTGETSVTSGPITVSMSTMSRTDNYRAYASSQMTVSSSNGNITKIEVTCTASGTSNYGPGKFSGEGYSYSGKVGTWTGSAKSVSLSASAQVRITQIVVTYLAPDGVVDPAVSFESNSLSLEVGETTTNAISKPNDLNVTYSSGDANVATVDANGVVTGVGVGQTNITASWNAVADTYNAGSESYAVNVTAATPSISYVKVTNRNQLVAGNEYILMNAGGTKAMGAVDSYGAAIDITSNNDKISIKSEAVNVLTLGDSGNGDWVITSGLDGNYLSWSSGNTLSTSSDIAESSRWKINFKDGAITIRNTSDESRYLQYNTGNPRFACYTSSQTGIMLYVKEGSPTMETADVSIETTSLMVGSSAAINISPEGLAVTYSVSDNNVIALENGFVTALAAGEATITATWVEQTINGANYRKGSKEFTITVTEPNKLVTVDEKDGTVTFVLTDNDWGFPTDASKVAGEYSNSGYALSLGNSDSGYKFVYNNNSETGYFLMGKSGATLTLPAFDFAVEKIEVVGRNGASGSVVQNIYVGENAASEATTGATGTNTYKIASDYQAAGNIYTLKVTSAHNTQITSIKVYRKNVAQIGEGENAVKYETLEAAVEAATAGQTITLLDNINLENGVTIAAGKNIVLDLNGKVLSLSKHIANNGTLTIQDATDTNNDGSGTGKIASNAGYTIVNTGTLTINNGTYTNTATDLILQRGGNITINGGSFTSDKSTVVHVDSNGEGHTLTITNGTFTAKENDAVYVAASAPTISVSGGEFITNSYVPNGNPAAATAFHVVSNCTGGTINISGGTFKALSEVNGSRALNVGSNPGISVTGGDFYSNAKDGRSVSSGTDGILAGGTFDGMVYSNYVADGKFAYPNNDFTRYTIENFDETRVNGLAVAKIGDTYYTSLEEVSSEITEGCTVTLLKDLDYSEKFTFYLLDNMTFDGNGHTLTGNILIDCNNGSGVARTGITIKDTKFVNTTATDGYVVRASNLSGNFTVIGCTFDNTKGQAIQCTTAAGANVTITGNTFKNGTGSKRYINLYGTGANDASEIDVVISENIFYEESNTENLRLNKFGANNNLDINGNYFEDPTHSRIENFNESKDSFEFTVYGLDEEGKIDTTSEQIYVATGATSTATITPRPYVAQIEGGAQYYSLADAVAAVPTDGTETTITMIEDETIDVSGYVVTVAANQNVVLELNGHQIVGACTSNSTSALIRNLGTLTIQDNTDANKDGSGNGKLIAGADPTWTWDGSDNYSGSYASNLVRNEGTLIVESGNLLNVSTGSAAYGIDNYSAGNVTINGGKVDAAKASAVRMFYVNGGSVTVNGGIVGHYNGEDDSSYMGIQVMGGANVNVTINGGTIAGDYAFYANNTGGEIVISDGTLDGYVGFGSAGPNNISITGGTFYEWVGTYGSQTKFISGGTYSVEPGAAYIADGYVAAQQGDVYVIIPASELPIAPIVFHDEGTYEGTLDVAIAGQGTIMYKLGDGEAQAYSAPFEISETTKVTAWAEQDGIKSSEVSKTFTIVEKTYDGDTFDGYYTIKNNGNGKFVNVAGRKTVTFESETADKPGTVIRVKTNENGQVEVLRSQGVDLPRYAEKAMNYVPELAKALVERLGENDVIGEDGVNMIADEFKAKFDYHLYLEKADGGYRIYGKTPSMKHVVDFYANNKEIIDSRLPKLEGFVEDILKKVAERLNHADSPWASKFKIHDIWTSMGGEESNLTEPVAEDEESIARFYTEVLSSEKNVWDFAYQTAMIYWTKVEELVNEHAEQLGDYSKYLTRVKNIKPDFKYYIVVDEAGTGIDFISEGNAYLDTPRTSWTLAPRTDFNVNFDVVQNHTVYSTNGGVLAEYSERYTTLYTDFAYTLPDGVKAYKVKAISDKGVAVREEIEGTIPAQTPVMLVNTNQENPTKALLALSTEAGTAVTGNLLVGADELINEYEINSPTAEGMFTILATLSQSLADKYEYLKRKNSGTVNNKYFFGLTEEDAEKCVVNKDCVIRNLSTDDNEKTAFHESWEAKANKALLVSEKFNPILLSLVGDVDRDGKISIGDVTALVNIILGKATYPKDNDKYDFEAAEVDGDKKISIADVTKLVNIILGKE